MHEKSKLGTRSIGADRIETCGCLIADVLAKIRNVDFTKEK